MPIFCNTELEQALLASGSTIAIQQYRLHAVACDVPLLIVPLSGQKYLHTQGRSWRCGPGEFLMMHFSMQADVENIPDGGTPYRAWVLPFTWEIIALARDLLKHHPDALSLAEKPASTGTLADIADALQAYMADAATADNALRDYRLLGILLALFRAGHGQFIRAHDPGLSARIRIAVSGEPAKNWASAHFEEMFFLSGATLRRRLSGEGVTLRTLIQEARLHAALLQLQNGCQSVKAVAHSTGYRSVTSFRRNFIERFNLDPAKVSNSKPA